jgi:copper chaperone CopZ
MSTKIVYKIIGMECPNCAMTLESIEDKLKGVIAAQASYHKSQLIVEFDETQLNEENIKREVKRLGYDIE